MFEKVCERKSSGIALAWYCSGEYEERKSTKGKVTQRFLIYAYFCWVCGPRGSGRPWALGAMTDTKGIRAAFGASFRRMGILAWPGQGLII